MFLGCVTDHVDAICKLLSEGLCDERLANGSLATCRFAY